jgi:DNA-binding helix-hairpin-helix protein with protein kinase domain
MHLQGNLQIVFDALYTMGVIDPVLKMDWQSAFEVRHLFAVDVSRAVAVVNRCSDDVDSLMLELQKFDDETLKYLAMEVAREYADYHARKELH